MGAFEGADRLNSSIANFIPTMGSADADIIPSKPLADGRAQHLLNNDAYVQGGQQLHRDNIVGSQFLLNARPMSRTLFGKIDDVWENEFQEEVEELFDLAAESPDHLFDAAGMNTFTGLIRLAVGINCACGETLASAEWIKDDRPFRTAIQMIDTARLATPEMWPSRLDPNIRGGVKKNSRGKPVSYYIRKSHPNDLTLTFDRALQYHKFDEVAARTKWGRAQILHIMEQNRPDQTRGISDMAAALKEIHITHKWRDIQVQNAVMQSLYAAAITSELPSETVFAQLGGGMSSEQIAKAIQAYAIGFYDTIDKFAGSAKNLHVDGVRIPHLLPGTKLDMIAPSKGGPLGTEFEQSLLRYIAATLGVSYEQLSRDYTNTNYASARAAMADTWRFMQARKKSVADKFATMIYRLWLEEMVSANMLTTFPASKVPMLFTGGHFNLKFEAITRCDWIGASRGQIDELKETQAAVLRINNGLSTREDEIARLGGDWRKKMRQLKREKDLADSLGLEFNAEASANMMNAANGTADDADEKGKTK
jgi:lambda family phage portal protein